eukprot:TRINITY_DN27344_c0_g1_i1.p1 TRINITY_DN27344_c0_g1~~TRINITY_DN27344_c0_g1_i1.p1  ORF type:complete len:449 (+),score=83.91 TRINITY_DN27344_c0_g1_i1:256-1602(+)
MKRFQKGYLIDWQELLHVIRTSHLSYRREGPGCTTALVPSGSQATQSDRFFYKPRGKVDTTTSPLQGGFKEHQGTEDFLCPPSPETHLYGSVAQPSAVHQVRSQQDQGLLLTSKLKAKAPDCFDPDSFNAALAHQLGLDRSRLSLQSWSELDPLDPREPNVQVLSVVTPGQSYPTLATVEESVLGIVHRSHSCHRHIAGYPLLQVECTRLEQPETDRGRALASLIHRMRSRLYRDRIRLRDFMKAHDNLHKRVISKAKFRTALATSKMEINQAEMDLLEGEFEVERDPTMVHYDQLCDALECVFGERDGTLEMAPTQRPRTFVPCGQRWDRYGGKMELGELDRRESLSLHKTCQRVASLCSRRRIALDSYLRDRDTRRSGVIDRSDFRSVMNLLELEVDQEELDVLFKRFAVPGPEVNYVDFVNHCWQLGDKVDGFMAQPVTAFGENQ